MSTKSDLVQYIHRCAFIPVITTWNKLIDTGYFSAWPGLTSEIVCKHLPNSMSTSKGLLLQDRQNFCSTKPPTAPPTTLDAPHVFTNEVCSQTIKFTGKISTDQTGRFLVTSSRGRKYIMVLYDHDNNAILPEPIKSRIKHKLIRAYSALHSKLTKSCLRPNFQILDNECPASLKELMRKEGATFQLVPTHQHQTPN